MKHINLSEVRRAYAKGINITDFLKTKFRSSSNTSEIIEIAYDLQAGSYIDYWQKNTEQANLYAAELATILDQHTPEGASILDVGTGEMTTLTTILNHMNVIPSSIFALDLSWSRIIKGIQFFESHLTKQSIEMNAFVSDMSAIPITSNSIDVITSSHALEPNAAKLDKILCHTGTKFWIDQKYFTWEYSERIMFNKKFCKLLGIPPRLPEDELNQDHKDLAAA